MENLSLDGVSLDDNKTLSIKEVDVSQKVPLTVEAASKLTTYELRQELIRRNKLDIPENQINYKTMLHRLIQLIVEDEQQFVQEKTISIEEQDRINKEKEKEIRQKKKEEALLRSKLRQQQDPDYFIKKQEANQKKDDNNNINNNNNISDNNNNEVENNDNDDNDNDESDDVFNTLKKKASKIFVR